MSFILSYTYIESLIVFLDLQDYDNWVTSTPCPLFSTYCLLLNIYSSYFVRPDQSFHSVGACALVETEVISSFYFNYF